MYNEKYEEIDEIVESIRKNSRDMIIDSNGIYGDFVVYKQPSLKKQLNVITSLMERGVNVQVINAPVGLAEGKDGEFTIEIQSRKYTEDYGFEFKDKSKTVFILSWVEANKKEDNGFMGLIRFIEYEEECKLKDLSVAV